MSPEPQIEGVKLMLRAELGSGFHRVARAALTAIESLESRVVPTDLKEALDSVVTMFENEFDYAGSPYDDLMPKVATLRRYLSEGEPKP